MKTQFKVNEVYAHGFFSGDTMVYFKVTKRTEKSIWVQSVNYKGEPNAGGESRRVKIAHYANDYEMAYPNKACMAIHANDPVKTPYYSHQTEDDFAVYKNVLIK